MGDVKDPIYLCKRKEVPELFTEKFWQIYEIWRFFHYGFGLPQGQHWSTMNPAVVNNIREMEALYDKYFSKEKVIIDLLEANIKVMKVGFRLK